MGVSTDSLPRYPTGSVCSKTMSAELILPSRRDACFNCILRRRFWGDGRSSRERDLQDESARDQESGASSEAATLYGPGALGCPKLFQLAVHCFHNPIPTLAFRRTLPVRSLFIDDPKTSALRTWESRMREICTSGSMSGMWKRGVSSVLGCLW